MTKTWLITGVSGGLGREIALAALARGDLVFGTVRKAKDADAFELLGGHALVLDVTDEAAVRAGVAQVEAAAGSTSWSTTPATAWSGRWRRPRSTRSAPSSRPTSSARWPC
jgi:NAD(P)-dependent dehydrogenase (short-subunit alcohol dehydrogenase family)